MAASLTEMAREAAQKWAKENVIATWDDVNRCTYFIMSNWIEDPDDWYEWQVELMNERAPA